MDFQNLIARFTDAGCRGDGRALAALFTEDGVYHDCFYGDFRGREAIRAMIEEHFHRDAEDFAWEMRDPVLSGSLGYARYLFGFTSKLDGAAGRRIVFEGMSCFYLEGALVRRYHEVFDSGLAMAQLGFAPERLAKSLARRAAAFRAEPAVSAFLGSDS